MTDVTERPLGPFSNVICWVKGHELRDDELQVRGYECARCWKRFRLVDTETDRPEGSR